jgi:hypothetical protein
LHQLQQAVRLRQSVGEQEQKQEQEQGEQETPSLTWFEQLTSTLLHLPAVHELVQRFVQLQLPPSVAAELAATLWDVQEIFCQPGQTIGAALFQTLNLK